MKTDIIKAIFTNLLFVIGVILLIFGFINGTSTAVKLLTFEKYPLQTYEETRCAMEFTSTIMTDPPSIPSAEPVPMTKPGYDAEARRQQCLESQNHERRVKKTDDIVTSFTTLIAGIVLVFSFKKFIFKN